jgi:hypothetical protein
MARLWGGRSQMRKDECMATIRQGLNNPERVRAALAELKPFERTALALAKQMGGEIEAGALTVGLRASGVRLPESRSAYAGDTTTLIQPLIRRGLFLSKNLYGDPAYIHSSYGRTVLFSDERLLAHVGPLECHPFYLKPAPPPPTSTYRRPPTVVLDIIGILQAINDMGGLGLTQSGTIRVNDQRKLMRAMGWEKDQIAVNGLSFPNPALAFVNAFRHSDLLVLQSDALVLKEPTDRFATRSYAEQVSRLLSGFIQAGEWTEWQEGAWYSRGGDYYVQGRLALTLALAALPADTDGFFALDDLDQALFERVGEHFSLRYPPHRPYHFNKTPEEVRQAEREWRAKLRTDWLAREKRWIESALSTWLYYLGLVELGMQAGAPVSVRLTELGRAVLHPELAISIEMPAAESQAAWIVQPNFDVVVYLDRTTPEQLAFLERHAERVQAQQHTAQYRLTRESVYQGLESGTSLDELLAQLQAGAGAALPQNVVVDIREWGALREHITLRRRARVLEFPDGQARQAALQAGVAGIPVGERFLLLPTRKSVPRWIEARVDYARPLPKCLMVSEEGVIGLKEASGDLLIDSQLDHWAERKSPRTWQLTRASVSAAVKAGARVGELFRLLQERLTHPLPPLLGVALRAWAGETFDVEVATVAVLRCKQPAVFQAIVSSRKLRPYLRGQLAPDILLVDTQQVEALKEQLAWAGLQTLDELSVR